MYSTRPPWLSCPTGHRAEGVLLAGTVGPRPSSSALLSTQGGSAGETLALGPPDGIGQAVLCQGYCHHMATPYREGQRPPAWIFTHGGGMSITTRTARQGLTAAVFRERLTGR